MAARRSSSLGAPTEALRLGPYLRNFEEVGGDPHDGELDRFLGNFPAGRDFVTLNVPADQKQDCFHDRRFSPDGTWHFLSQKRRTVDPSPHNLGNPIMATACQRYSCVAIVHSRAGARKLLQFVGKAIRDPVDGFICKEHHKGNLRGNAPSPCVRDFVTHREHGTLARATGLHTDRISGCRRPN